MNPYQNLPPQSYWRSGVQLPTLDGGGYPNLWRSKFPIDSKTKIITVGSCFAQHISKWIKNNGFSWVDSEPGNPELSLDSLNENGYGVFSFRTGNIYTPALLKQWVTQALKLDKELDEVFFNDGCYYDAFRPLIPKDGFVSAQAARYARQETLTYIRSALQSSDVFIFTLGLTEAWTNRQGWIYPLCPGTVKGEFISEQHQFVNFTYDQILADLNATIDAILAVNPKMRFLFTVSPVPLTATAEPEHILNATSYSKSVLRAAAGHLAKTRAEVDYFPSYELISQFPSRGRYYEENLRSVKKEGVDFVMRHFESGIGLPSAPIKLNLQNRVEKKEKQVAGSVDEYCEDILLEDWNQSRKDASLNVATQVFLVGDSHLDATAGAIAQCGLPNAGGMIMRGHTWAINGFELDDEEIFVPLDGSMARKKWRHTLLALEHSQAKAKYLVTNIGLHTNVNIPRLYNWAKEQQLSTVNAEQVLHFFQTINIKNIALVKSFIARGFKCIVVSDPPTQSLRTDFVPLIPWVGLYEKVALHFYSQLGCEVVNVRDTYSQGIPEEFYSQQLLGEVRDWVHGSPDYYLALGRLLTEKINALKASET